MRGTAHWSGNYTRWSSTVGPKKWLDSGCMLETELTIFFDWLYIFCETEGWGIISKFWVRITGRTELTFPEIRKCQEGTRSSVFSVID